MRPEPRYLPGSRQRLHTHAAALYWDPKPQAGRRAPGRNRTSAHGLGAAMSSRGGQGLPCVEHERLVHGGCEMAFESAPSLTRRLAFDPLASEEDSRSVVS